MLEFASVSAPSIDPAALAAKLTEKSTDGWTVVGIVATGGDVTAYLSRESSTADAPAAQAPAAEPATPVVAAAAAATVAEPAGWGAAPEATAPVPAATYQPQAQPTAFQPQAQPAAYQPAAVAQPAATPGVPAGWYADPAGRFELRYWDGGTWTEHVSRAGQQFTDPPVA
jgi:hypothetical protein